eukprot:6244179-Prymnesium_polylepis.1
MEVVGVGEVPPVVAGKMVGGMVAGETGGEIQEVAAQGAEVQVEGTGEKARVVVAAVVAKMEVVEVGEVPTVVAGKKVGGMVAGETGEEIQEVEAQGAEVQVEGTEEKARG